MALQDRAAGVPDNATAPGPAGGYAAILPKFDMPKPHHEPVVTSSASLSAFQRHRQRRRDSPTAPLMASSPSGVQPPPLDNKSAAQPVARGNPPTPQQQAPNNAMWRTLTEFIQLCDNYVPSEGTHASRQPRQPQFGNYSSPKSLGELLRLGEASQGSPRNISRVIQALHDITVAERGFAVMTEEEQEAMASHGCSSKAARLRNKKSGRSPRIGILMISSGAPGYVRLSELNKQRYAQLHGYQLHILPPADSSRHPAWSKIPAALSLLPLYDWLWLVDADTLVMTPAVPLAAFIDDHYDMVLTRDCNNINTGSWLIRNSQWTEAMLATTYARPDAEPRAWWEQAALIQLAGLPSVQDRIKVLPTNKGLNSYGSGTSCNDRGLFGAGDLLVHFPGAKDKEAAFQEYWQQLPVQERKPLPSM
ncbi:hypothetical protein N2152v2_002463 [Parachlorella kessleri]